VLLIVTEAPRVTVIGGETAPFYRPHYVHNIECQVTAVPAADVQWFRVPCTTLGCVTSEPQWQPYTSQFVINTEV